MNDTNLSNYSVVICAVVFGTDATILNVQLGDDFSFQRKSLIPTIDHLDAILKANEMGLRREYEGARIDDSLDVICIFKEFQIELTQEGFENYYDNICNDTLKYLDDKIRAIRLFVEGSIRFKKLAVEMQLETQMGEKRKMSFSRSSLIPIAEAMITKTIQNFSCTYEKIRTLNEDIINTNFPLEPELFNNCHMYYDLSYHQINVVAITLLITCLEILFLDNENTKKEKLSKRCAVFLFDSQDEQIACYKKLALCYKKRSDFVHDGTSSEIPNGDILFLRECVRRALIKYIRTGIDKSSVIKSLKSFISDVHYLM